MTSKRNALIFTCLCITLALLFCLNVCKGDMYWLWPFGHLAEQDWMIFRDIRLPKAITAVLAGAALSVSGLIMQTLFRNPLAGPYTLGVSSGASLGVALLTMCTAVISVQLSSFGLQFLLPFAACVGASLVLLLVIAVSRRVKSNVSLLIVGMMFGSIAGALVSLMQMFANPDVLILDEPTRGIDVGAKYEIYCIINDLAKAGKSVIMISSELPEVIGMSDRIYIMNQAKIVGEMKASDATQENIMACIVKSGSEA